MDSGRRSSRLNYKKVLHGLTTACVVALCVTTPLSAQNVERYETVQNRARPELDALGLPFGAFTLYPSVELRFEDVDNIFADDAIEQDDTILRVDPQLRLVSGWSRHRLTLGAEMQAARYSDFDNEDYEDVTVWGDGRIDLSNGRITVALRHSDLTQERSSTDDNRSVNPVEYSVDRAALSYRYEPGANFAQIGVEFATFDFDDAALIIGGIDENDDRDRDITELKLRVGRRLSDEYAGFIELRADEIDYDQEFDQFNAQRSSDGYQLLAGTTVDISSVIFGEVYAGYRERDYDDAQFQSADGLAFGADVTWNVTGLTTLNFSGSREIDSTTIAGASGIEETRIGVAVDHELRRNLIVSAQGALETEDFEGLDRDDDIQRFMAKLQYMMNRNIYLTAGFEHRKRDTSPSNSGGREYTINSLFIQVRGQL